MRMFVLDMFERHGKMHGYQVRSLAEKEHAGLWIDLSGGSFYQLLKRLAADKFLSMIRTEKDVGFPERQIYEITDRGRQLLYAIVYDSLNKIDIKHDAFDFAMSMSHQKTTHELEEIISIRLKELNKALVDRNIKLNNAKIHLTDIERYILNHRGHVIKSEIEWHENFLLQINQCKN